MHWKYTLTIWSMHNISELHLMYYACSKEHGNTHYHYTLTTVSKEIFSCNWKPKAVFNIKLYQNVKKLTCIHFTVSLIETFQQYVSHKCKWSYNIYVHIQIYIFKKMYYIFYLVLRWYISIFGNCTMHA